MASFRIDIKRDHLLWALRRAGATEDSYVAKYGKKAAWLAKGLNPTMRQLEEFSNNLHAPFGYFFLDEIPTEKMPIPVYRGHKDTWAFNLNLYDTISTLQYRQEWLEDYLRSEEIDGCICVGIARMEDGVKNVACLMAEMLGLGPDWAKGFKTTDSCVNRLATAMENAGITVVFNGVVGLDNNRVIAVEDCRGFALINSSAPFVYVNSSDAKSAQMFTLAHEMCHILLGISAGSGGKESESHLDDSQERFCDAVAAEFLMPTDLALKHWTTVEGMAKRFHVSLLAAARKAFGLGLITREQLSAYFSYSASKPKKKSSGGDFYATAFKRIGYPFAVNVRNALADNKVSYTEAFSLLGVKASTFDKIMQRL
ncbi:MAG: ImmA/IrrE family metallo-endopeptidase [Bacteroidales bacterium]|nr:ImmA/IrrE family metallo-endopeptidase [Bacteroidales bacterium]